MRKTVCFLLLVAGFILPAQCFALPGIMKQFVATYPEVKGSQLADCRTCHLPAEKNCLNAYAEDLKENHLDFSAIAAMDSDEDGVSNIEEIGGKELPGSRARADEIYVFNTRMGDITFDHQAHALDKPHLSTGACENCHAEEKFPRKFDDSVPLQNLGHSICKGCHKESGSDNAPTRCRECHVK